ncbi:MAG TPA: amidohydrolase family protein [Burkholderiales bacterium]|jgi:cytosine/adenosine deaminase-related metal-dependent hydrolase
MSALIMRGRYLVPDARQKKVIADGAIAIAGGRVADSGSFAEVRARHPQARVLGNARQLLMPGLIDAHSHGRGLSPIQKGAVTDFLENALFDWAYMPVLPPELTSGLCALRHIRSGCTTLHHNSFDDEGKQGHERAHRSVQTYLHTGIRLVFSPSIRPTNRLALDDEAFWKTLPPDLQAWSKPMVFFDRERMEDEYFELFDSLHSRYDGEDTKILLSVSWAHGTTESFLKEVKALSQRLGGTQIHMHTLQTPVQKAYGLKAHGKPTLRWLDELGYVERNVTYGHAIHVTEADIALMASKGASITHHPSCNLHMRNGIAPVIQYLRAGVNVAMGMDDKTINDDEDAVMELRMIHKIHRLASFDLQEPAMDAYTALQIATTNAARVCGFENELGSLKPGMKADAILVDLDRVANDPWIDPALDIIEAFVQRGLGADVASAVIAGKVVMEDRKFLTMDVDALYREVREFCAKGLSPEHKARADMMMKIKPYMQAWYRDWEKPVLGTPFYTINSRS